MRQIHTVHASKPRPPYTIAIDFDGTLFKNKWPEIGEPNIPLIESAIASRKLGAKLVLWTNREGELLQKAVKECKKYGLEFDSVNDNVQEWQDYYGNNSRKVGADEYWDDKAIPVYTFLMTNKEKE